MKATVKITMSLLLMAMVFFGFTAITFAQGNGNGNGNFPPGFCNNVQHCIDSGSIVLPPDIDWKLDSLGNLINLNGGNVGIDTANPIAPLHVKGQIICDSLHVFSVGRFGNTISINSPLFDDIGSNSGQIHLVGDVPLSPSNIKVGIGTQAPNFMLDVAEDVNIGSGRFYRIGGTRVLATNNLWI